MSIRWRCDGSLICGAKSEPRHCDTYIDDRMHYQLSIELKVIKPDSDENENGIWHWVDNEKEQAVHKMREREACARLADDHPSVAEAIRDQT